MLQVRQQPSISVHHHSQTPSSLLLSDYRMDPLRSGIRMDGQPQNMGRCYEHRQLSVQEPRHKNDPLRRRSLNRLWKPTLRFLTREIIAKTLSDSGISRSLTKGQWESSQVLLDHLGNTISSKGPQVNVSLSERRCRHLRRAVKRQLWIAAHNRCLVCSDLLRSFTGHSVSAKLAIPLTMFPIIDLKF